MVFPIYFFVIIKLLNNVYPVSLFLALLASPVNKVNDRCLPYQISLKQRDRFLALGGHYFDIVQLFFPRAILCRELENKRHQSKQGDNSTKRQGGSGIERQGKNLEN